MKKELKKIKVTTIGKKLLATIDGVSYPSVPTKEEKEAIIKAVENYNEIPTEHKKAKIIKLLTPKTVAKVNKALATKAKTKREVKTTRKKLLETTKEIKQLSQVAGTPPTVSSVDKKVFDKRFTVKEGQVYLNPFLTVPMPKLLVDRIKVFVYEKVDVTPLINFWKLALLNSNEIARTKLFDYIALQNLTITPKGYFVTYRMVKDTGKDDSRGRRIYTSAHTGKEQYFVGEPYKLDRSLCDEDGRQDCSKGLHTGTPQFIGIVAKNRFEMEEGNETVGDGYGTGTRVVTKTNYPDSYGTGYGAPEEKTPQKFDNQFGNQAVICLINPMHVVSIPNSNTRKMRSCEIFICKATTSKEVIDMVENDYLIFDHKYHEYEAAELDNMLKTAKLKYYIDSAARTKTEAKKKELEAKIEELKKTLNLNGDKFNTNLSLTDINNIIKSRIQ